MGTGVGSTAPFGRLLRAWRHSRRLTIEELAVASGVSGRAIGDMERGRSRRPHHALARLGERAEAAAEYRAVLALDNRVPADVRNEAHAGLAALTAGRPAPLTRFVQ